MVIISHSVEETRSAGVRLAAVACAGDVYALEGDLGAGKTEFVRGFISALSEDAVVKSPSFAILNVYQTSKFPVYHFDFYRLNYFSELGEIGLEEYISGDGVCLIEWGTVFPGILPENTRIVRFIDESENVRRIESDFQF